MYNLIDSVLGTFPLSSISPGALLNINLAADRAHDISFLSAEVNK